MATYDSPQVDVQIIDESFYNSAGPGTVPLIIIATHKNKPSPSGIGIAPGSLPVNGGQLSVVGSQRELIQYFGNPKFYTNDIGTPVHGYELNEYGLHAAYQYLAMANRVFIINAAIDLNQLQPTRFEPTGLPIPGTFWFDTNNSRFGIFVSDGGSVPGVAWQSRGSRVIDQISEVERAIIGTAGEDDANAPGFVSGSETLTVNDTIIQLPQDGSINQIVAAINNASVINVSAETVRIGGFSYLKIANIMGGRLDITSSNAVLTALFGVTTSITTSLLPKSTIGSVGDFAIITLTSDNVIYQKLRPLDRSGLPDTNAIPVWFIVGSRQWKRSTPTVALGSNFTTPQAGENLIINISGVAHTVAVGGLTIDDVVNAINNSNISNILASKASSTQLRIVNLEGDDLDFAGSTGTSLSSLGLTSVKGNRLFYASHTQYPTGSVSGDVWIRTTEYNSGAKWVVKVYSGVTGKWTLVNAPLVGNSTPVVSQTAEQADDAKASAMYSGSPVAGVLYVRYNIFSDGTASHQIRRYNGASWQPLGYEVGAAEPTSKADDGTLWYSEDFKVDIMVNLGGGQWVGYQKHPALAATDAGGPFLQASPPTSQRSGASLVQGDLWIDTGDMESYPAIYRYTSYGVGGKWIRVDNTDQTTPFGIVFDDVREDSGPTLSITDTYSAFSSSVYDLVRSNYVDPDCVDPRHYPDGTLLFNLRYSTLNVKEWQSTRFAQGNYDDHDYTLNAVVDGQTMPYGYTVGNTAFPPLPEGDYGRWVTVSGLKMDGSPYMARKAQRKMVVESMQSAVVSNEAVRAETMYFNLMAAPGYVELVDEMISLNVDKKETAFIVADTPARLLPTAQAIQNWVTPSADAQVANTTEDALGTNDPYVGVYYPWGLSTNNDGNDIMIPPSTMVLRVFAQNDNVAWPWMAAAGYTRGLVTNATTVGYLTSEGEFKPTILNQKMRDNLYLNKVNPIAYIPQRGLLVFGNKTLYGMDSAMDRVNVARLANYLRYHADNLAKQFIFEPNVQHTRDVARITFERFLSDLIATNGLYDFLVVCDESNNTPARIDRNELWIDIAIQPVKAIEFVIIPIRLRNTGADLRA